MAAGDAAVEVLCRALLGTLDADAATRSDAEAVLKRAALAPGFLVALSGIILSTADPPIRTGAAIYFKNELRRRWDDGGQDEIKPVASLLDDRTISNSPSRFSAQEKQSIRSSALALMESVMVPGTPSPVTKAVDSSIRYIALMDFPKEWPGILEDVTERLRSRDNVVSLGAALAVLRALVKKFEYRAASKGAEVLRGIVAIVFAPILELVRDLCESGDFNNNTTAEMLKTICKIYWSLSQISLAEGPEVEASFPLWMELCLFIMTRSYPSTLSESRDLADEAPQMKALKWAVQIAHRLLDRHGPHGSSRLREDPTSQRIGKAFMSAWANKFLLAEMELLKGSVGGQVYVSDRVRAMMIQYMRDAVDAASLYKVMKPDVEFMLTEVCFPLICYCDEDVEAWESDPIQFIRNQSGYNGGPRDCAVSFIQAVARVRGRDFFEKILSFAESILVAHSTADCGTKTAFLDRRKDGALYMIGALACRLKSKKRNMRVEKFLADHVVPELTNSSNPFLRRRACMTIKRFLDLSANEDDVDGLHDPGLNVAVFCKVRDLLVGDREMPVRVAAALCLEGFFSLEGGEIREAVITSLPQLMESLLAVINQNKGNEEVVTALETLISNYEDEIPPYAVSLVTCLADALLRILDSAPGGGENTEDPDAVSPVTNASSILGDGGAMNEDLMYWGSGVNQAIASVLSSLSESKFSEVYNAICPTMVPVLDKLLSPECFDFAEEAFVDLTLLTSFCPSLSQPVDLWKYFDRTFIMICGEHNIHLPLDQMRDEGFAAEELCDVVPCLYNYMYREPERFLTGKGACGIPYTEMVLKIARCSLMNHFRESPYLPLELMALIFEAQIGRAPTADHLVKPVLSLVLERIECATVSNRTSFWSALGRLLGSLVLYNHDAFFSCVRELCIVDQVSLYFSEKCQLGFRAFCDAKIVVLALAQLLDLFVQGRPPGLHLSPVQCARSIGRIMPSLVFFEKMLDEQSDCASFSSDSEQDLEESQDAEDVVKMKLAGAIKKHAIRQTRRKAGRRLEDYEEPDEQPEKEAVLNPTEEDDSDGDEDGDDDEDSDDTSDEDTKNGDFLVRESSIKAVNELELVERLVSALPAMFIEALGEKGLKSLNNLIRIVKERRAKDDDDEDDEAEKENNKGRSIAP